MIIKRTLTSIMLLFFMTGVLQLSYSQTKNDYSNVKVDELSDAQVRQLMKKGESLGYDDVQLEKMVATQGMPQEEVQKLRFRIQTLRQQAGGLLGDSQNQIQSDRNMVPIDSVELAVDSVVEKGPEIFGAQLFKNSFMSFQPNLNMPTPLGYIIGPGDQLNVDITGDNEASYQLTVNPEGIISVQYIGLVAVGGLSIEAATSKIKSRLSGTYPGIQGGRTQVALNLGNIRSIRVTLLGEVVKPGSYTLPSLATVFNALYASGGPNKNGSFREIEVIRNNKIVGTIDVYDFLLRGMQANNIRLQDQDVIRVPVFQTRVEIDGEVKRPALYEVLPGESFQDLLDFAGSFTTNAYTATVKVLQNTNRERRVSDIVATDFDSYIPHNGDQYTVEAILDRYENRVEINGAVFRPGTYSLEDGLTLKDLIGKADGVTEDAFLPRGYIYRLKSNNDQELISFDVGKLLKGTEEDVRLQREDKVTISSIFDLRDEYKVTITGEVRQPQTFRYADNMTLGSIIQQAGGFKEGASPNRIEIARRIRNSEVGSESAHTAEVYTVKIDSNLTLNENDFVLRPFDIISVRSSASYEEQLQVRVEGEVVYPGTYTITRKDERISDVIARAGGLTALAYAEGASLKRPQKVKSNDTNAINIIQEEQEKAKNLARLQGDISNGEVDVNTAELKALRSDLVGIQLGKILKQPHDNYDLILEEGDIIRIPKLLQTVRVSGEILRPNSVIFSKNKAFKYYVRSAGGFTEGALKRGAYVQYANGSVAGTNKVLLFNSYPKVKPGAEIFVPKRAPREKLNAQGWIGISTAVVSMAAMIFSLVK